ncbi:hypothetical protein F0170_07345 [Pseudomonas sp. MAFF 730085]|uniref:Tetratricopeptide repeat protein n=1 Tax=Pseudomonas kitaguniensis TaxID=2607908 RepID=A0A5N7JR67_9PSED|nr:CFI-box-CTERM domain-containing protein [Pseudomonas kitaguniensis]MPQ83815.1 hypothetical protein [Pseudomonas kitaguniensis]
MSIDNQELGAEAQQYHMKAMFILHELQANRKVYGSNSVLTGASPANVDLALQYIDRSLETFPDNAAYLNLKALLLWEGKGDKDQARTLLERAAALKPGDIDIQNNLKAISTSQCFIATAAYGHPLANEIHALRRWRDNSLSAGRLGRLFIAAYYKVSPAIAVKVSKSLVARSLVRGIISVILRIIPR